MENLILGVFSEQLSKLIVGFRKEQVNANLLSGKGEITDVDINVDLINDLLRKKAPFMEFQSIHVTKVSFNVTSVTNLKKAPIVISVDEVHMTIVEPLEYQPVPPAPTEEEAAPAKKDPLRIGSGQYGLFDRIGDNLTLEINRVYVSYQTWGKFKTRRRGVWTPPSVAFSIHNLKYVSVDEFGEEGTPDEVWRHNKPNYVKAATKVAPPDHRILDQTDPTSVHSKKHTLLIYKKLSMLCNVTLQDRASNPPTTPTATITTTTSRGTVTATRPAKANERTHPTQQRQQNATDNRHYLVRNAAVEIHLALQKRKKDAELLGIQVDVALTSIEVDLDQSTIPLLAHVAAGVQHALAKDRSFADDPLLSRRDAASRRRLEQKQKQSQEDQPSELENIEMSLDSAMQHNESVSAAQGVPPLDEKLLADADRIFREEEGEDEEDYDEEDDDEEDEDDDDDEGETAQTGEATADVSVEVGPQGSIEVAGAQLEQEDVPHLPPPPKKKKKKRSTTKSLQAFVKEKACFTLSIQNCTIRATYHPSVGGYMQMNLKGLVTEVIWPKNEGNENGGYLQLSLSYINLQERHGKSTRAILIGGGKKTTRLQDLKKDASVPAEQADADEFPKFERRSLRDDLRDLRSSFPAQAIGLKSTVTFGKTTELNTEADIHVDNEVGVDQMDFIVDADPWTRFLHFCLNTEDGGFDPRWYSGKWSDNIVPEMLVSPIEFDIEKHLQPLPDLIHAENSMITSDMITVTTRARRVLLRLPAPVHEDIRSGDILVSVGEAALVVSSELPRSFLTGRITGGTGEDATHGDQFPNDPSDVSFSFGRREQSMEKSEMESKVRSKFRIQADISDCGVQVRPAVPLCASQIAATLLAPTNISMMVSFEGEAPASLDPTEARVGLYVSMLLHSAEINVDLDMICSAAATVLYHVDVGSVTLSALRKGKKAPKKVVPVQASSPTIVQINRIRKTGTLGVVACVHIPDLDLRLWRQNVPLQNRANSILSREDNSIPPRTAAPLVLLCRLRVKTCELEVDFLTGFRPNVTPCAVGDIDHLRQRRIVAKTSTAEVKVLLGDFDAVCSANQSQDESKEDSTDYGTRALEHATEVLCLGGFKGNDIPGVEETDEKEDRVSMRLEYRGIVPRALSISADVGAAGTVATSLDIIETFVALMVESLLKPVGECCKNYVLNARQLRDVGQPEPELFRVGTVGAFLHALSREAYYYLFATIPDEPDEMEVQGSVLDGFGAAMVRCRIRNMLLLIAESQKDCSSPYGLLLEETSLGAGFFNSVMEKWKVDLVVCTRSGPDKFWDAVFDGMDSGIHLNVSSRQSLYQTALSTSESDTSKKKEAVLMVPTFGANAVYSPKKVDGNLDHLCLSCFEVSAWGGLIAALEACATQASAMVGRAPVALFVPIDASEEKDGELPPNPFGNASEISARSVKTAWDTLRKIKASVDKHDNELRSLLTRKEGEVGLLSTQLFLKERQRVTAMALISSQTSGWVRFGTTKSPLRVISSATLWKRWAVLRRSLLVISESSSSSSPIDIISLEGAKLFSLEGQLQKSDSNRGFVVVDAEGRQRIFVVSTAGEYEMWIGKLSLAIDGTLPDAPAPSVEVVGNGPEAGATVPENDVSTGEQESTTAGPPVKAEEMNASEREDQEVASSGGDANVSVRSVPVVPDDGKNKEDGEGDGELQATTSKDSVGDADDDQSSVRSEKTRDQLRQKMSAIGSSTKSRFGAAMQSARKTVNAAVDSGKALQGKLQEGGKDDTEGQKESGAPPPQNLTEQEAPSGPLESVVEGEDNDDTVPGEMKPAESTSPESSIDASPSNVSASSTGGVENERGDAKDSRHAESSGTGVENDAQDSRNAASSSGDAENEKQDAKTAHTDESRGATNVSEVNENRETVSNEGSVLPLRQKMSVLGSTTKKGFGAAMLSARQKMNSAVESGKKLPGIVQVPGGVSSQTASGTSPSDNSPGEASTASEANERTTSVKPTSSLPIVAEGSTDDAPTFEATNEVGHNSEQHSEGDTNERNANLGQKGQVQLRQKMSVLGSSTKTRFGAAMLSARNTVNSAVDTRKQVGQAGQGLPSTANPPADASHSNKPIEVVGLPLSQVAEEANVAKPDGIAVPGPGENGSQSMSGADGDDQSTSSKGSITPFQVRQKISVLGSSTKTRFGAAMLSARSKVNAAVDRINQDQAPTVGPETQVLRSDTQEVSGPPSQETGGGGGGGDGGGLRDDGNAATSAQSMEGGADGDDQSTSKGSVTKFQVRQKISVLGSSTKTRFGAAMQSARNKMNASVDNPELSQAQDAGVKGKGLHDAAVEPEAQVLSSDDNAADVSHSTGTMEVSGLPKPQEMGAGSDEVDSPRVDATGAQSMAEGDDQSTSKGSITQFQVRQKISVLGSSTKTRFGAAMQTARSKVNAAVENQKKSRAVQAAEREVTEDRVGDLAVSELSSDVSTQDLSMRGQSVHVLDENTNRISEMQQPGVQVPPKLTDTGEDGVHEGPQSLDNPGIDQVISQNSNDETRDSASSQGLAESEKDNSHENMEGGVAESADGTGNNQLVANTPIDAPAGALYRSTEAGLKSVAKLRAGGVAVAKLGAGSVAKLGAAVKTVKLVDSQALKAPSKALTSMSERVGPSTSGATKAARSLFSNTIKSAGSVGRGFTRDAAVTAIDTHSKPWKLKAVRAGVKPPELKTDAKSRNPNESFFTIGGTWLVEVVPRTSVFIDEEIAAVEDDASGEESALRLGYGIRIKCLSKGVAESGIEKEQASGDQISSQEDEGKELYKTLPDMLLFHSSLSEALREHDADEIVVDGSSEDSKVLVSSPTRSALELVGSLGMKLEALLQALKSPESLPTSLHLYSCEAFEEFLHAIFKCPIPIEASRTAQRFLELDDIDWSEVVAGPALRSVGEAVTVGKNADSDASVSPVYAKEVVTLAAQCESELAIAQSSGYLASQLAKTVKVGSAGNVEGVSKVMTPPSLLPTGLQSSDALHSSLQKALFAAMAERDEAQAQLVAANVLHVHEVEQERKRAETLEMKLAVAEQLADEGTAPHAAFFLGQDEVPQMNSLKKHEKEMMQNTDEELSGLCQQLSNEIASRTSGDLELLRIKESRRVELEGEAERRMQLQSELDACKDRLRQAEEKWEDAAADAIKWKNAFEEAVSVGNRATS